MADSVEQAPPRSSRRALLWGGFALAVLVLPVAALVRGSPELPVLFEVPDFALVDHHRRPFTRADMQGRVWVVDFIFTSCAKACPTLTARMKKVQGELAARHAEDRVGLLSISVDPESDTPERLAGYAEDWAAEAGGRWLFLTGDLAAVESAVVQGFRVMMGKERIGEGEGPTAFEIMHGTRLLLVDAQGRIRGFYDPDAPGTEALVRDAMSLVEDAS